MFLREFPRCAGDETGYRENYRNKFFCLCVKLCITSVNTLVLEKKRAEIFLTSLFKMPDKTLSKENLLTSGSVSSPQLNSKLLSMLQAIAGDKAFYCMASSASGSMRLRERQSVF